MQRGSLTHILLHKGFVTALHDVVSEAGMRNQVTSIEGTCGQFLCDFRVALDRGKPKFCATSLKFTYLLLIHRKKKTGIFVVLL